MLQELDVERDRGLAADEAGRRIERFGRNSIEAGRKLSPWALALHQFTSPLIYILLAAAAVTIAIGEFADAIVISIVLAVNAIVGFVQEYRAENAIRALMNLAAPRARVRREGEEHRIPSDELVPGDIVIVEAGDVIPADLRLLDSKRLRIEEAILTGESVASAKQTSSQLDPQTTLADRTNMAYMGTAVSAGSGVGVVTATGDSTEMGAIAGQLQQTTSVAAPLEQRMSRFAQWISAATVTGAVLVFGIGLATGEELSEIFLTAVAVAVSVIPEGLPIVMTIAFAVGVRRMARRNAIVRKLPAVETLGSCTVIVSDKTGTLTQNRMTVRAIWADGRSYDVSGAGLDPDGDIRRNGDRVAIDSDTVLREVLRAGLIANEAELTINDDGRPDPLGDPTEVALIVSARKAGMTRDDNVIEVVPFDPDRKYSAAIVEHEGGRIAYLKGAPEQLIARCTRQMTPDGSRPLDREDALRQANEMARGGLRVLAMARADGDSVDTVPDDPHDIVLLGLQGMLDPPREGVEEAVEGCHRAGMRVIVVTGDHATTAGAIARMVGIEERDDDPPVPTGSDIDQMSDEELRRALGRSNVFARIAPSQKLRIVEALRAEGEVIAVTGDGVNDAPALQAAHIGVAMGEAGTDVAKEASEIVLTDDNFASVYGAVEEGRISFSNIRKATFFLVSSGVGEFLTIVASLAAGRSLPLVPAQLLWLNVITNGVQDVALAFEPGESELMQKPPRSPNENIVSRLLVERLALVGILLAAGTLGIFIYEREWGNRDLEYARVAALTTLVMFQMFHVFNARSEERSVFRKHPLSNRFLVVGVIGSIALHVVALYLPPTQFLLDLEPLSMATWARCIAVGSTVIMVVEVHKWLRRSVARIEG